MAAVPYVLRLVMSAGGLSPRAADACITAYRAGCDPDSEYADVIEEAGGPDTIMKNAVADWQRLPSNTPYTLA